MSDDVFTFRSSGGPEARHASRSSRGGTSPERSGGGSRERIVKLEETVARLEEQVQLLTEQLRQVTAVTESTEVHLGAPATVRVTDEPPPPLKVSPLLEQSAAPGTVVSSTSGPHSALKVSLFAGGNNKATVGQAKIIQE